MFGKDDPFTLDVLHFLRMLWDHSIALLYVGCVPIVVLVIEFRSKSFYKRLVIINVHPIERK